MQRPDIIFDKAPVCLLLCSYLGFAFPVFFLLATTTAAKNITESSGLAVEMKLACCYVRIDRKVLLAEYR